MDTGTPIVSELKARLLRKTEQLRKGREVVNELLARFPEPACFEQEDAVRHAKTWLSDTDPNQLSLFNP